MTSAGDPIYVHAKVMIADTRILTLGSSNLNDRSLGFDTECNISLTAPDTLIEGFRTRLLAEHLCVTGEALERAMAEENSMIGAIDSLNDPDGRGLRVITDGPDTLRSKLLTQTRLMDPRYLPGEAASAGQGIRPRHIALGAGAFLVGYLGWRIWNK